jgi:hypothetical protein
MLKKFVKIIFQVSWYYYSSHIENKLKLQMFAKDNLNFYLQPYYKIMNTNITI